MLNFSEITLADQDWCKQLLRISDFAGCDYTFGNLFNWQRIYGMKICRFGDFLLIRYGNKRLRYLFPAGSGDLAAAIGAMRIDAQNNEQSLVLELVDAACTDRLRELYGDQIEIIPQRNQADYIYFAEDLINLSGKKYHAKRNHIAKFESLYDWRYEPISETNLAECIEMNRRWCEESGCGADDSLREESCSVTSALHNFTALELEGGLIRVDGAVIAFTIGERQNSNTFCIHVEKALSEFQGGYPMINRQFLLHNCQDYTYINREEDMGIEGLRKAKLSYRPLKLLEKNRIIFR